MDSSSKYSHLFKNHLVQLGLLLVLILLYVNVFGESEEKNIEKQILESAEDWMGTPYKMGGEDKNGVDCSAFTQTIIKDVFDIDLPRRVKDQKKVGLKVELEEMQAGDLVVFKTGGFLSNRQHIGIYLSDYKFLHASSSEGVTVSSLEDWYWKKKYRSSRRIQEIDD